MNFTSVSGKKWVFKKFNDSDIKEYSEKYSLNEIVARLLAIRKKNIKDINLFLNPTIKNHLPNPLIMKDMKRAITRTHQCIINGELIGGCDIAMELHNTGELVDVLNKAN